MTLQAPSVTRLRGLLGVPQLVGIHQWEPFGCVPEEAVRMAVGGCGGPEGRLGEPKKSAGRGMGQPAVCRVGTA